MKLVICEKSSLAKNFASAVNARQKGKIYINNDYVITNAVGHLLTLKSVKEYNPAYDKWKDIPLPFIPEEFEYIVSEKTRGQYNLILDVLDDFDFNSIIHLGDADREGQLIVDNILDSVHNKLPVERLWLPAQTKDDILAGLNAMKDNKEYSLLHDEGATRTYMDWLLGINLTVFLSVKTNNKFIVGRVLIPIVKRVYDRDLEIRNFKPEKFYELSHVIEKDKKSFSLVYPEKFFNETDAYKKQEKLNSLGNLVLGEVKSSKKIRKRPRLFSLDKLQKRLNNLYAFDFKKSLDIIQKLYEEGYLSYPRTDSEFLSESEFEKTKNIMAQVSEESGDEFVVNLNKDTFNDSKVESHSAITITNKFPTSLSADEDKVYETVLTRMKAHFCKDEMEVMETTYIFNLGDYIFTASGEAISKAGFSKYENVKLKEELPILNKGDKFKADFIKTEKITSPPKKITEATLFDYLADPVRYDKELNEKYNKTIEGKISLLKDSEDELDHERPEKGLQIGTQASRTNIFENTIKYGYITKNGKTLSITEKGENLINILNEMSINLYASKSVEFESMLIDVKTGKKSVSDAVDGIADDLNKIIYGAKDVNFGNKYSNNKVESKLIGDCPKCGKKVFAIKAKNGYIYKCENNDCNFIFYSKQKRFNDVLKISVKDAQNLLNGGKILATLTNKEGKKYTAYLKLNAGEKYVNFDFDSFAEKKAPQILGKCPDCGKNVLALPMKKGGTFFICENKENCDFKFSTHFKYFGDPVDISLEQSKALLEGKTINVELRTLAGKRYNAEVKMVFNNGYANLEKIR